MEFDMNQAIRDFFGVKLRAPGPTDEDRHKYNERLMSELLTLLVKKNILSKGEALTVVHNAHHKKK